MQGLNFIDMSACSVFIVVCLFCMLYFICILFLLLPTWRTKPDDTRQEYGTRCSSSNCSSIAVGMVVVSVVVVTG